MKGLVIWGHSTCRSVMGLYRELIRASGLPALIPIWRVPQSGDVHCAVRQGIGFRSDEFCDLPIVPAGEDYAACRKILDEHRGWLHLFCDFQLSASRRQLILDAKAQGNKVGILNEAPCNMERGMRAFAKRFFLRFVLPHKVGRQIRAADFFVNYSGDDDRYVRVLGWPEEKVIHLGYYPPQIEGSTPVLRTSNSPFTILLTGILARYRGADILVEALRILKKRGVAYRAIITQDGDLKARLCSIRDQYDLPIDFPGRVSLLDLIKLYESCSVYVGSGRNEPWGMRLNDALNCGAPLVVSRGMGGVKLVEDYKCGLAFDSGDAHGLADALERLATDRALYVRCAQNAMDSVVEISPASKGRWLWEEILKRI